MEVGQAKTCEALVQIMNQETNKAKINNGQTITSLNKCSLTGTCIDKLVGQRAHIVKVVPPNNKASHALQINGHHNNRAIVENNTIIIIL